MGVQQHWDTTPANNATADSLINWREGQAASTINDSARSLMAQVAKLRKDIAGMLVTGGGATAYTISTNESFSALADGMTVSARMHATNGASATLNVDSLGAKAIQSAVGTAVPAGALLSGAVYEFTYYAAGTAWLVRGLSAQAVGSNLIAPSGTVMLFGQNSAPTGWTKDTSLDNAALRLTSGNVGDGGTAAWDDVFKQWTISQENLPNINLTTSTDGAHAHTVPLDGNACNAGPSFNSYGPSGGVSLTDPTTSSAGNHSHTVPLGGSGTPLEFRVKWAKMIRATKD